MIYKGQSQYHSLNVQPILACSIQTGHCHANLFVHLPVQYAGLMVQSGQILNLSHRVLFVWHYRVDQYDVHIQQVHFSRKPKGRLFTIGQIPEDAS